MKIADSASKEKKSQYWKELEFYKNLCFFLLSKTVLFFFIGQIWDIIFSLSVSVYLLYSWSDIIFQTQTPEYLDYLNSVKDYLEFSQKNPII